MLSLPREPQHLLGGEGKEIWRKNLFQETGFALRGSEWSWEKTNWEVTGDEGVRGLQVEFPKPRWGLRLDVSLGQ